MGPRAPKVDSGTALALDIPRGPDLPFPRSGASTPSDAPAARPSTSAPPPGLTGTAPALNVPRGPATPFRPAPPGELTLQKKSDRPHPATAAPNVKRDALTGTAPVISKKQEPTLPFFKPQVNKAPKRLVGTSLSLDLHRGPLPPAKKPAS